MFGKIKSAIRFLGDVKEGFRQLATPPAAEWRRRDSLTEQAVEKLTRLVETAEPASPLAKVDPTSLRRVGNGYDAYVEFRLRGELSPVPRQDPAALALKERLGTRVFESIPVGTP